MKRILTTGAAFAVMVGWASVALAARGQVYVTNCTDQRILVCTFDGNDSMTVAEADRARLAKDGQTKLTCQKKGKSGCKVKMANDATSACGQRKGTLFPGRHEGYFRITGKGDDDLVQIDKSVYDSDDPCGTAMTGGGSDPGAPDQDDVGTPPDADDPGQAPPDSDPTEPAPPDTDNGREPPPASGNGDQPPPDVDNGRPPR